MIEIITTRARVCDDQMQSRAVCMTRRTAPKNLLLCHPIRKAFTLVELLVVIAIIGVLVGQPKGAAIIRRTSSHGTARRTCRKKVVNQPRGDEAQRPVNSRDSQVKEMWLDEADAFSRCAGSGRNCL